MNSKTYCNPLSLPHFQQGQLSRHKNQTDWGWRDPANKGDFREMADPAVLWFQGKWWLFPSCGMIWHTDDFVNWEFAPIEPFDIGYAPAVCLFSAPDGEKWILLTACGSQFYRAQHPLGPWENLGPILNANGEKTHWDDPALFADDDGRLFCYHGLGPEGIFVVELDANAPQKWLGTSQNCFAFNPENRWEWAGDWNEDDSKSMTEGAWMTKHGGRYYLQYSGPGTEWKTYGIGCYVGSTPFGPWEYQTKNPILVGRRGDFVNGCGHGSLVQGPNDPNGEATWWYFYTILVRIEHAFERRIGMDAAGWDAQGNLFVAGPSQSPCFAPGTQSKPENGNQVAWKPLSVNKPCRASSYERGFEPQRAFDDEIRSWWEAAPGDEIPTLEVNLGREYQICASRICFADSGLNYQAGIVPAPYRYQIEVSDDGQNWRLAYKQSNNLVEKQIAYDTFEARATWARLRVLEWPKGMKMGVWQWTLWGENSDSPKKICAKNICF